MIKCIVCCLLPLQASYEETRAAQEVSTCAPVTVEVLNIQGPFHKMIIALRWTSILNIDLRRSGPWTVNSKRMYIPH